MQNIPPSPPPAQAPNVTRRHKTAARQKLQHLVELAAVRADRRSKASPPVASHPQNPALLDLDPRFSADPIMMAQKQLAEASIAGVGRYQALLTRATANNQAHEVNLALEGISRHESNLDAALTSLSQRITALQTATLPLPSGPALPPPYPWRSSPVSPPCSFILLLYPASSFAARPLVHVSSSSGAVCVTHRDS